MENNQIKLASFKEALACFNSQIDSNDESIVTLFSELKEKGKISHENEKQYWHGGHSQSQTTVTMYRIEEPLLFYIVETVENGNDSRSYRKTVREIFIPKEC
jgi:hypothetical protein